MEQTECLWVAQQMQLVATVYTLSCGNHSCTISSKRESHKRDFLLTLDIANSFGC